jgi:hypothetical protein
MPIVEEVRRDLRHIRKGASPITHEQSVYERSVRGKTLVEEREGLSLVGRKLRKEIANGVISGKGRAWLESKQAKLLNVGDEWSRVNALILDGHVTRHRAQGREQGLGTKNFIHFSA